MTRAENRRLELPADTVIGFESLTKDDYIVTLSPSRGPVEMGADLRFQKGPFGEFGVNGITNEVLLEVLIDRTKKLDALFPCTENKCAIGDMESALVWFNSRTAARRAQGVEGTNAPHTTGEPS